MVDSPVTTRHRWEDIPRERLSELLERRLITGERVMLAQVHLARGCVVPEHSHENEQMACVLEGALSFRIGGDEPVQDVVRAGEVLHLPSNVPHEAEALEDSVVLDVFSPPRQDWLDGSDDYLRR